MLLQRFRLRPFTETVILITQEREELHMKKIVLASASPRRRELLSQVGVAFEVKPASGEEPVSYTHLDVYKRQDIWNIKDMK